MLLFQCGYTILRENTVLCAKYATLDMEPRRLSEYPGRRHSSRHWPPESIPNRNEIIIQIFECQFQSQRCDTQSQAWARATTDDESLTIHCISCDAARYERNQANFIEYNNNISADDGQRGREVTHPRAPGIQKRAAWFPPSARTQGICAMLREWDD